MLFLILGLVVSRYPQCLNRCRRVAGPLDAAHGRKRLERHLLACFSCRLCSNRMGVRRGPHGPGLALLTARVAASRRDAGATAGLSVSGLGVLPGAYQARRKTSAAISDQAMGFCAPADERNASGPVVVWRLPYLGGRGPNIDETPNTASSSSLPESKINDVIVVVVGIGIYFVFVKWLHAALIGIPIMPGWRPVA